MFVLLLTTLLSSFILGDQDYNLNITNPKTVRPSQTNQTQLYKDKKITFSINSSKIDFGALRPTVPVLRESILKVDTSGWGYSILGFEDHPLQAAPLDKGAVQAIPDTTCDNGACSEVLKSTWDNPLVFGFGASLDGKHYQQFASIEDSEIKQVLASKGRAKRALQGGGDLKVNYKLNVPGTQISGIYTNTVTFILVPDY